MALRSDVRLTDTEAPPTPVPDEVRAALTAVPRWEKQLLELGLHWPDLTALVASVSGPGTETPLLERPDLEWAASQLRVFLLTWDPFEWQPDRPAAFATSARRPDGAGVVLYLPHWQALALAGGDIDGLAAVLGQLGESVLAVAASHRAALAEGRYAAGVRSGSLPALLSSIADRPVLAAPSVSIVGPGWQPIQFDVLEDLAQDAFGPADLDRSPVRFCQPGDGRERFPACPGCADREVDFPDGLKDTQEAICPPHRSEALAITTARLESAQASNPAGWEALLEAGQRLLEPHLPDGLGPRLAAAAAQPAPTRDQLASQAALVIGAGRLMVGLPDPQTALGGRLAPVRPWLEGLAALLAANGLGALAGEVSDAAAELLASPSATDAEAAAARAAADLAAQKPVPYRREVRVGRNAPCPCGSGKKYKFCHGTS